MYAKPHMLNLRSKEFIGISFVYTDILSYDAKRLQEPLFEIGVTSIEPMFKDRVSSFASC